MESLLHDISWVLPWRSEPATLFFKALTLLGYTEFFLVMLPLGFWLWDKALFSRVALLIGVVGLTNFYLKDLFQDPRPAVELALDGRVGDSFGLPSGHAQIATALWLWLAYELKRPWAWAAAIVIAAGVAFSRIYLGVHDLEDVLGGTIVGLACFAAFAAAGTPAFKPLREAGPAWHLAAIAALAPLVYLLWPKAPVPPAVPALVGFLFVWVAGAALERRLVGYRRHPNLLIAGLCAGAGIAALFALTTGGSGALAAQGLSRDQAVAVLFPVCALFVTLIGPALFRLAKADAREPA